MKKWKRKYKELKVLYDALESNWEDYVNRAERLEQELLTVNILNSQLVNKLSKCKCTNTGSDYDVDIAPQELKHCQYFNEDKTPNQEIDPQVLKGFNEGDILEDVINKKWTIEKLYIKLTNEFPGISLKASTLCNSNYGSLEIPCISIYNETISLHPDGKLHWDFRKDDDILEQFISYIKKEKQLDNASISSNGQTNLEDFSKAVIKEDEDLKRFSNLPIDPNNPTNLEQFHKAFKFKREETIPDWVIGGLLNGLEVLPITEVDQTFERDQPILHKLL